MRLIIQIAWNCYIILPVALIATKILVQSKKTRVLLSYLCTYTIELVNAHSVSSYQNSLKNALATTDMQLQNSTAMDPWRIQGADW